ncbi:PIN domain-containing protein [Pontibacter ruber]|uniref:PIN domain-containing protein n=1 Tax=Pontibacter ruber TaxID=1343895 RepID=A0ABW5CXT0_9BACT|nr:PIN domain-containing protein [Pontibacter ruber]
MTESIVTRSVAIDTSYIESQNFLKGKAINEFARLCKVDVIQIYITDITYNEVLARFKKNLNPLKSFKSFKDSIRILKNIDSYDAIFDMPEFDKEALSKSFKESWDDWLKVNKIEIIETTNIQIGSVFAAYFDNTPPFRDGIKKHEFPDAFTLKGLEEHFNKLGRQCYIVSGDKDILEYSSDFLLPIKDGSELLDLIIRTSEEYIEKEKYFAKIQNLLTNNRERLEFDLQKEIRDYIEYNLRQINAKGLYLYIKLESFKLKHINLGPYLITHLDNTHARIEFEVEIEFSAVLWLYNLKEAYHDVENDIWHNYDQEKYNIKYHNTVPVTFKVHHTPTAGERFASINVESINNGESLEIYEMNNFKL